MYQKHLRVGFVASFLLHTTLLLAVYIGSTIEHKEPKKVSITISLSEFVSPAKEIVEEPKQENKPQQKEIKKEDVKKQVEPKKIVEPKKQPEPKKIKEIAKLAPDKEVLNITEETKESEASEQIEVQEVTSKQAVDQNALDEAIAKAREQMLADEVNLYLAKLRETIQSNLRYPNIARKLNLEGECRVSFEICSNGEIKNAKIIGSTSRKVLDEEALKTLQRCVPFDAPPKEGMKIDIPILFKLKS